MEAKAIRSGNIRSGTAIALGLRAPGAPIVRLTRAAIVEVKLYWLEVKGVHVIYIKEEK